MRTLEMKNPLVAEAAGRGCARIAMKMTQQLAQCVAACRAGPHAAGSVGGHPKGECQSRAAQGGGA